MINKYNRLSGEEIKMLITETPEALEELDTVSLGKLMNYETDLLCLGEGDMELIKRCSDLLDERRADEDYEHRFDSALQTATQETATDRKWGKGFKRLSTVAAVVAIMITISTFLVSAYVIETVYDKADSFVFFYNEQGREYPSFEEMVESEGLDIMYPTKMPGRVDIASVTLTDGKNGKRELRITTSDKDTNIVIQIAMGEGVQLGGNMGTHVIDGCNYYVFGDNSGYYAFCYYEDDYYSFEARGYDDLMIIIENMEK